MSYAFSPMFKQMWQIYIWTVSISENLLNVYWTFQSLLGDIFIKCSSILQQRKSRANIILHLDK